MASSVLPEPDGRSNAAPRASFGRWTVLGPAEPAVDGRPRLLCRCACGKERPVREKHLLSGKSVSCGCSRAKARTHGATVAAGSALRGTYNSWRGMRERCSYPRHKDYHLYGGKGVKVCERWDDFAAFLEDMGPKPSLRHSIERKDNAKGYSLDNCEWALPVRQARHTSRNRLVRAFGRDRLLCEWAEETGLPYRRIEQRIREGWTPEDALSTPVGGRHRGRPGERHHNAKLSDDAVRRIRTAHAEGRSCSSLAEEFRTHPSTVEKVVRGRTWKHVASVGTARRKAA